MTENADWFYEDFDKIIAIRFGNIIHFGDKAIQTLKEMKNYTQLLSIAEFKMLCRLDLGEKFGKYAEHAPVLFTLPRDTKLEVRIPNFSEQCAKDRGAEFVEFDK